MLFVNNPSQSLNRADIFFAHIKFSDTKLLISISMFYLKRTSINIKFMYNKENLFLISEKLSNY